MTDLKRQPGLPREPVDPLEEAMAALRKLPEGQRWEHGKEHLVKIFELVLGRPERSAVIEEAARLCGLGIVRAQEIRSEVEQKALEITLEKMKPKPVPENIVRVICDPETVMRMREAGRPRVSWEYNPFDTRRIFGE